MTEPQSTKDMVDEVLEAAREHWLMDITRVQEAEAITVTRRYFSAYDALMGRLDDIEARTS